MAADFQLIETMRVSESGEVYLLDRHLDRLSRSARYFDFKCDPPQIVEAFPRDLKSVCLRIALSADGAFALTTSPLPIGYVSRLKLSSVHVNSTDPFLYHKTSRRGVYDQARTECDHETDAILINERGEITETTVMNIAVLRNGRWITPEISCGLLPGVMREELLSRGEIFEGVIRAVDLHRDDRIRCFNALRGIHDVPLL